ncbi:ras association domain-containing protein 4 isoform X2 [Physeter macrocephalus]|uniref:Ras association domain-containing protein 4 isoform X2 n=1 Tax=Physeter macrocephalus TaxID=9755 RepID=A0A455AMW2_PHYMC|nr:ras association domain-containing protein 4 isoform X2 [Physeter catodon]|eukprot:XP_028337912.1 ras association domain-containing protein 4 isoform X2 [Physeter catodon]
MAKSSLSMDYMLLAKRVHYAHFTNEETEPSEAECLIQGPTTFQEHICVFTFFRSELLSLLKTYNCYHEGRSFQLRHREEEGALIIEGLLNISWGLRRPIRLQIQDDRERVHLSPASWAPGRPKEPPLQDGRVTAQEPSAQAGPREESSRDSSEPIEEDEETPQLMRTKSDAACVIQRRPRCRAAGEAQRIRRHRFSINGHFYNHKTSVFTPAYGSMTNVRVNSTMTTLQVLTLLLNKFRVENGPSEFALYIVHESGGECLPLLPDHKHKSPCPFGKLTSCARSLGWPVQRARGRYPPGLGTCYAPTTSTPPRPKSRHIVIPFRIPPKPHGKPLSPVGSAGSGEECASGSSGWIRSPSPTENCCCRTCTAWPYVQCCTAQV